MSTVSEAAVDARRHALIETVHAENLGGEHVPAGFCRPCADAHLIAQRAYPEPPTTTWLHDALERWGEPRLSCPDERPGVTIESDHGRAYRRYWMWFVLTDTLTGRKPVNHHLSIDRYGGADTRGSVAKYWIVTCGYHGSPWADAIFTAGHEPTDTELREVIRRGWGW